jgi:hypothetical protein
VISVKFRVDGLTDTRLATSVLDEAWANLGVIGSISELDHVVGSADGTLEGVPRQIALFAEKLLHGAIHGVRAMLWSAQHSSRDQLSNRT